MTMAEYSLNKNRIYSKKKILENESFYLKREIIGLKSELKYLEINRTASFYRIITQKNYLSSN